MDKIVQYIPDYYFQSIYDISYDKLLTQGIKTLFFDLDNTIISYDVKILSSDTVNFFKKLQKSFEVIVISNSRRKRVALALSNTTIRFVSFAIKPLKSSFGKALKLTQSSSQACVAIGDQILTDIKGAKKWGIKTILVDPIERKSDSFWTKINRHREKKQVNKIKKYFQEDYEKKLREYYDK